MPLHCLSSSHHRIELSGKQEDTVAKSNKATNLISVKSNQDSAKSNFLLGHLKAYSSLRHIGKGIPKYVHLDGNIIQQKIILVPWLTCRCQLACNPVPQGVVETIYQ